MLRGCPTVVRWGCVSERGSWIKPLLCLSFGSIEGPDVTCDSLESEDGRHFLKATAVCDPSTPPTITAEQTNPVMTTGSKPPLSAFTALSSTPTSQRHLNEGMTKRDFSISPFPHSLGCTWAETLKLWSSPHFHPSHPTRPDPFPR